MPSPMVLRRSRWSRRWAGRPSRTRPTRCSALIDGRGGSRNADLLAGGGRADLRCRVRRRARRPRASTRSRSRARRPASLPTRATATRRFCASNRAKSRRCSSAVRFRSSRVSRARPRAAFRPRSGAAAPIFRRSRSGRRWSAERVDIYTDVSGAMTADPRRIPTARTIDRASLDEMSELAQHGAKVMHDKAAEYARGAGMRYASKGSRATAERSSTRASIIIVRSPASPRRGD